MLFNSVIKADEFTKKLLDIYKQCKREGLRQKLEMGIFRSDYMINAELDSESNLITKLQQIEINAISASFSHLGALAVQLHKCVTKFPFACKFQF
jgi:glutathione synthase